MQQQTRLQERGGLCRGLAAASSLLAVKGDVVLILVIPVCYRGGWSIQAM